MQKKVIVKNRSDDVHAHLDGETGVWGCGATSREAVGNMVQAHPGHFGIRFEYPDEKDLFDEDEFWARHRNPHFR